jgi:RHS repeat-associated protein
VGTPKVVTDATGNVVKLLAYDSFGCLVSDSNPAVYLPVGFAGGLADADTGLMRFGFRDYDPATGRWTAKDPIFFGGGQGNLYAYCGSDPVNLVDMDGLFAIPLIYVAGLGLLTGLLLLAQGQRPPNMSPTGAGRRGAFREAKRNSGVPVCEQPKSTTPARDNRGDSIPGRDYDFGNGKVINDHAGGHEYPDDPSQNRGPHFNDPEGRHYDY